jgi:hypothetical protein
MNGNTGPNINMDLKETVFDHAECLKLPQCRAFVTSLLNIWVYGCEYFLDLLCFSI